MVLPKWVLVGLGAVAGVATVGRAADEERIEQLNRTFLEYVRSLGPERAIAAGTVIQSWEAYRQQMPESFVPDALAVLHPAYRDALAAFDAQRFGAVTRLLEPLRKQADPYLAANARYFHVRALVEQGLLEEAEAESTEATAPGNDLAKFTPYVAHLWFLRAYCEASNLRFEQAAQTLAALEVAFPDAPEPVRVGARQLALEIERRERGTLDEVAAVMGYSAARLKVADVSERVRGQQAEAVALLDRLIQDTEQQESQNQTRNRARASGAPKKGPPGAPIEDSRLKPAGAGQIGDLHAAPKVDPGEMWGRLPPAEREKILQSLRDRFPSRYRQLVEQYYRSLAEEK
jgi:hypothetical protein